MKRKLAAACVIAMTLSLMAGCSSNNKDDEKTTSIVDSEVDMNEEATKADTESDDSTETDSSQSGEISPMPTYIDLDNLEDCTIAVSFEDGDVYKDDSENMYINVTVYDYDIYDAVDISELSVGDVITVCAEEVEVTSVEQDGSYILINGGTDEGGYTLATEDDSTYHAVVGEGLALYYEIGKASIPVSSNGFEFVDSSDLDKGTTTYNANDLLAGSSVYTTNSFSPNNTTVTLEGGYATYMLRVYVP